MGSNKGRGWVRDLLPRLFNFGASTAPPSSSYQDDQPVHQLWPPGDDVGSTDFDVVFFHGLQRPNEVEAWKRTWASSADPQDCWAQNWLPQDLDGNIRVLALSYDSYAIKTNNQGHIEDVSELGRNVLQSLVFSTRWKLGQQRGIVLVGHSYGGLVIKSLVEEAHKRAHSNIQNQLDQQSQRCAYTFLKNLRGVVFYAVPHAGSELESYFTACSSGWSARIFGVQLAGFMQNLRVHQSRIENLSTTFDSVMDEHRVNVYGFLEGIPMQDVGYKLVENAVAQRSARDNYYTVEDADHFKVCRPPSKQHPSYDKLVQFLKTCRQEDSSNRASLRYVLDKFRFYKEPTELVDSLLQSLKAEGETYIIVHGKFGYGKTALVNYVMHKYENVLHDMFPGGIFQMKYGHNYNMIASQGELLTQLTHSSKVECPEALLPMVIRNKVQKELNMLAGHWLLIVDNVWSGGLIMNESPIPSNMRCKFLITSRFPLKELGAIRIEVDERSNRDPAAKLLASKAANDPKEAKFPAGCKYIANEILAKCSGCMLAVSILGSVLYDTRAQNPDDWQKVCAQFTIYMDIEGHTPYDYSRQSRTVFAAIDLSLHHEENKVFSKCMLNVLRALALFFGNKSVPISVVKLAWKNIQPKGEVEYFDALVKSLIQKGLVNDGERLGHLHLHDLVVEYVKLKLERIDLVGFFLNEEGEFQRGRDLLFIFMAMYRNINSQIDTNLWLEGRFRSLWERGFDRIYGCVLVSVEYFVIRDLHMLLDSDAENAIFAISQPYKVTQQDMKALLRLMHNEEKQGVVAWIMSFLAIDLGADNVFGDGDIQEFIQLCVDNLALSSGGFTHPSSVREFMLELARLHRVFAENMICHEGLMRSLMFLSFQSDVPIFYHRLSHGAVNRLEAIELLVGLIPYFQGISFAKSPNLLKQETDTTKMSMELCMIGPKGLCHVDDNAGGAKVPFFELSFLVDMLKSQLQQACHLDRNDRLYPISKIANLLDQLVNMEEVATHIVESEGVELLLLLKQEECVFIQDSSPRAKLFKHKIIVEALISKGVIKHLVSILNHGMKEEVQDVPYMLQILATEHEEVMLQLIAEVGVKKMAAAMQWWYHINVETWLWLRYDDITRGMKMQWWHHINAETWLRHEGITRGMAMQGIIFELLTGVLRENSEVCQHVLSKLVRYHGNVIVEDFEANGGLRLFLACFRLQPLNDRWRQLLLDIAQSEELAEKMVALGSIEMVADMLIAEHDLNNMNSTYFVDVVHLIKCLVEGFEERVKILLSKVDCMDLLEIHVHMCQKRILDFSFLPGAFGTNKSVARKLLEGTTGSIFEEGRLLQLIRLAHLHEEVALLIATKDGFLEELVSYCFRGNKEGCDLLCTLAQHNKVATEMATPMLIKKLLQFVQIDDFSFAESILAQLAKYEQIVELIVASGGIKVFLDMAENSCIETDEKYCFKFKPTLDMAENSCIETDKQYCFKFKPTLDVLVVMADYNKVALQIEECGGSWRLLQVASSRLEQMCGLHQQLRIPSFGWYERCHHIILCALKGLRSLVKHKKVAEEIAQNGTIQKLGDAMREVAFDLLWAAKNVVHEINISSGCEERFQTIVRNMSSLLGGIATIFMLMCEHQEVRFKVGACLSRKTHIDCLGGVLQLESLDISQHAQVKDLYDIAKGHSQQLKGSSPSQ